MLGREVLTAHLGGIYTLARLAREHPADYHTQIMHLLCAFARNPPGVEEKETRDLRLRESADTPSASPGAARERRDFRPLGALADGVRSLDLRHLPAQLRRNLGGCVIAQR